MTIVAYHRQPLFGAIVHKKVIGIILITGERRDAALLRPCYNNHHSRKVNVKHGLWGEDNEKPIIVK